jgi:hypothetical protein
MCETARRVPEMASFPSYFRHKMLCPDDDKIMPERTDCQGFVIFFCTAFFFYLSISYVISCSKYFKNLGKKMALS